MAVSMTHTVMIVEDNELNMKLFTDLLESQKYKVVQTSDGHKVIDLARQHKPNLILMDIQLPEISGLDLIKWLKESDDLSHIPIIAVTAYAMKGDAERILAGGADGYLSKPISVMQFLQEISSRLKPA